MFKELLFRFVLAPEVQQGVDLPVEELFPFATADRRVGKGRAADFKCALR